MTHPGPEKPGHPSLSPIKSGVGRGRFIPIFSPSPSKERGLGGEVLCALHVSAAILILF